MDTAGFIRIDKQGNTPVYRQVIEQITSKIKNGDLKAGERLPTERDLAAELGIARGTVTRAYAELEHNNLIQVNQGRGSFVCGTQDLMGESTTQTAVELIRKTLTQLRGLKFSYQEIGSLFQIITMEQQQHIQNVHVAAVDCNPEALTIFERQLRHVTPVCIHKFLLDELAAKPNVTDVLDEFDLILVTANHYAEITGMVPSLKHKLIRAAVSVSQQTIIDLAKVSCASQLGLFCHSRAFLEIMRQRLNAFQVDERQLHPIVHADCRDLAGYLVGIDILIVPPNDPVLAQEENKAVLNHFLQRGGRILEFNYRIDRGTLHHIEERIARILETR